MNIQASVDNNVGQTPLDHGVSKCVCVDARWITIGVRRARKWERAIVSRGIAFIAATTNSRRLYIVHES